MLFCLRCGERRKSNNPCANKLHTGERCNEQGAEWVPRLDGIITFEQEGKPYKEQEVYLARQQYFDEKRKRVVIQ